MLIYWGETKRVKKEEALLLDSKKTGLKVTAEKLSVCSCLVNKMQDRMATGRQHINSFVNVKNFKCVFGEDTNKLKLRVRRN